MMVITKRTLLMVVLTNRRTPHRNFKQTSVMKDPFCASQPDRIVMLMRREPFLSLSNLSVVCEIKEGVTSWQLTRCIMCIKKGRLHTSLLDLSLFRC
ncbi:uncharacterized protein [Panulirus ornatus]|uniref:uncharacterized protein isoform X2 n=1 Tax=Panulirus ornatus TaxID=150431 RepID=UPI003A895BBC